MDLVGIQTYLASNPIILQYQLATPQTINLTQQGLVSGQLQSFENGTCYIESDSFQSPVTFDVPVNQASRIDGAIDGNIANAKVLASLQEIVDTHIAGI